MDDTINPVFRDEIQGQIHVFKEVRTTPAALDTWFERQVIAQVGV